ncbi:MAG: MOSC domain-containing protein [Opitutaceae bacterium]
MRWSIAELDERCAAATCAERRERSRVVQVCVRPELNARAFPEVLELCPRRGAIGDRWERRTWMHLPDGSPDPRVQVALMDHRVLEFLQILTGCSHHPGDTLLLDLDLHSDRLPIGARLQVGSAVIEISDVDNDGCGKFAAHYGADVLAWIRAPANRVKRLRGAFARVVQGGCVRKGDTVTLIAAAVTTTLPVTRPA